jgi:hypothetical protein
VHKRDEDTYRRHLYALKKTFLDFIYHNTNSSKPSNLVQEVEEIKCSGTIKEKQIKELQNLKGGGQDTPTMVVEEQAQKVSQ